MPGHNVTRQMADAVSRYRRCSGGTSALNAVQHLSCEGKLRERFHLWPSLQRGGLSKYLRPCNHTPRRPPRLCKLVPVSHAPLAFQSHHPCPAGRGRGFPGQPPAGLAQEVHSVTPKGPSLSSGTKNRDESSLPDTRLSLAPKCPK